MQISNLHLADQYTVTMVIFEGVNYGELGAAGYAHALYSYKGKKQVQATFLVHAQYSPVTLLTVWFTKFRTHTRAQTPSMSKNATPSQHISVVGCQHLNTAKL